MEPTVIFFFCFHSSSQLACVVRISYRLLFVVNPSFAYTRTNRFDFRLIHSLVGCPIICSIDFSFVWIGRLKFHGVSCMMSVINKHDRSKLVLLSNNGKVTQWGEIEEDGDWEG